MKALYFPNLIRVTSLFLGFCVVNSQAQLSVDPASREQSRVFYNALYPASENAAINWTGNLAAGNPGSTSPAFKNNVFLRINFFRAMAGIPGEVTNNPEWSSMDQAAALMMSANDNVDHSPPTSWTHYSAAGATAASRSNLALSNNGSDAISSYMEDAGSVNAPVGHRRWILFPQTREMGTGDVPASGSHYSANALWTFDLNHYADERPVTREEFIAWPPKGFVPYQLIYPRWSFSLPNGNFYNARVSVTRNNVSIPVRVEDTVVGYGENTIVFVPNNQNPDAWAGPVQPDADTRYSVTVSNVEVGGVPRSFNYDVIAFDPARSGGDTPSPYINGPGAVIGGQPTSFNLASQTLATGYQWKYSTKAPYTVVVGAESNGAVEARVPRGYSFRDKKVRAVGNYSYHLTHPRFTESSFILKDSVLCTPFTKLNFSSRLTYSTNYESAMVEVSTDGGQQWVSVWTQKGRNNAGEKAFVKRSVSLARFQGREVKVRFRYALRQGSAYTQTDQGVGWYVDAISFVRAERLLGSQMTPISGEPVFNFVPARLNTYVLQARALVLGRYYSDWSPAKTVTAN